MQMPKTVRALAAAAIAVIALATLRAATGQNFFTNEKANKQAEGEEGAEALVSAEEYAEARTSPGIVLPGAYGAAYTALSALPVASTTWTEVTNRPYDADDPR